MSHETARLHQVAEDLAQKSLRQALRSLPARIPPPGLTTNLRVIASRERQRFLERRTLPQAVASWYRHARVTVGEMIRTTALPVAGGVCTAVILFSTWLVPTYPLHAKSTFDVPTTLTTEASVQELAATGLAGGDAVVEVTVNEQGRMTDYAIESGKEEFKDPGRRSRLEMFLVNSQFTPATEFGRPIAASKVRLPLSSSQIEVTPETAGHESSPWVVVRED